MAKQCSYNVDKSVRYLEEEIIKLKREIAKIKSNFDDECNPLKMGMTDGASGDNGVEIISEQVKSISVDNNYFKLVDSPESVSGIVGGHTVITLSDSLKDQIFQ